MRHALDTLKAIALISTLRHVGLAVGQCVASLSRGPPVVQSMTLDSIALALRLAFAHLGCRGGRRVVA
jgi:hypothetical protein